MTNPTVTKCEKMDMNPNVNINERIEAAAATTAEVDGMIIIDEKDGADVPIPQDDVPALEDGIPALEDDVPTLEGDVPALVDDVPALEEDVPAPQNHDIPAP